MSGINYTASPTMSRFHNSDAFVRSLFGPIGSGKSVACVIEMLRISFDVQLPQFDDPKYPNGVRKSRWVVVRNTYRELIDTTIQTFFDWYPEELGRYHKQDMKFTTIQQMSDGTTAHVEFLFRALDKPDDIKKLLSLEVTGGWLNEAREIPKAIMDMLIGRLLKQKILTEYPNNKFEFHGDPAGDQRAQSDKTTPFMMLSASGISASPTWTNDPVIRIGAVGQCMKRLDSVGEIGFIIGPKAPIVRKACAGGYKYRRVKVSGDERYMDQPDKNRYSHPADALQYMAIGMGEGTALISSEASNKPLDYSHSSKGIV